MNNEKGFLLGAETSFRESRISLYGDVFSFPWLRFGTNVPSEGYEVKADGITKLGPLEMSLHYKREEKPANYGKEGKITEIRDRIKEQYKLRLVWTPGNGISLQTRVECIESGFKGDTLVRGFFAGQDLVLQPVKMPFQLSTRIAWFSAKEWDARLYVYEKDLLYTGGSQMHYGCGWRYMGMIRWKMSDNFDLWLKVSQSIYPGKKETGSGLNRIERNHRTELKVQIKAEF